MKNYRKRNGRFKKHYYNLPKSWNKPIIRTLLFTYGFMIALSGTYIAEGKELAKNIKLKLNETKRIIIINEVGAGASDRDDAVSRETEQVESEVSQPVSIEQKIKEVFGEEAETAIAIAKAESSFNPSVIGDTHLPKPSIGLFQISLIYHDYTVKELLDPERNIEIAKQIYDKGGWCRWTTYKNNRYLAFL